MKKLFELLTILFVTTLILFSCTKKPLTLDSETSMKTLLKASDKEITELVVKEAAEKGNIAEDRLNVEYILRDEKSQAIAVKLNINKQ